jgi:hypothetical protein
LRRHPSSINWNDRVGLRCCVLSPELAASDVVAELRSISQSGLRVLGHGTAADRTLAAWCIFYAKPRPLSIRSDQ